MEASREDQPTLTARAPPTQPQPPAQTPLPTPPRLPRTTTASAHPKKQALPCSKVSRAPSDARSHSCSSACPPPGTGWRAARSAGRVASKFHIIHSHSTSQRCAFLSNLLSPIRPTPKRRHCSYRPRRAHFSAEQPRLDGCCSLAPAATAAVHTARHSSRDTGRRAARLMEWVVRAWCHRDTHSASQARKAPSHLSASFHPARNGPSQQRAWPARQLAWPQAM